MEKLKDGIIARDCNINGCVNWSGGTAGMTIFGVTSVINVASGPCIDKTGGGGPNTIFAIGTQFFSGGGTAISGGSSANNFVSGIILNFGTLLNDSIVSKQPMAGEFDYNPATPANWSGSPTTLASAIDRIAAVVASNHGAIP
jgi:hypothetical protein